jgi:hypothetical protein
MSSPMKHVVAEIDDQKSNNPHIHILWIEVNQAKVVVYEQIRGKLDVVDEEFRYLLKHAGLYLSWEVKYTFCAQLPSLISQ